MQEGETAGAGHTVPARRTRRKKEEPRAPAVIRPRTEICILGTTPSRGLAPFNNPKVQMWTIGPGGSDAPGMRWERLFEIHGPTTWPLGFHRLVRKLEEMHLPDDMRVHVESLKKLSADHNGKLPEGFDGYLNLLKNTQPPKIVYTTEPIPDWPANKVLDKARLFRKWGRMWFSSSISYAIALAIEEEVTDLHIYGIDLESGEEYRSQHMGARHFIDMARSAFGVNIHLPQGCGLLRDPNAYPDAYETNLAMGVQSKMFQLDNMLGQARGEFEQARDETNRREGAILALKGFDPLPDEAKAHLGQLEKEKAELQRRLSELGGMINRIEGERNAFDFVRSRFIIHGDDPGAIAA